MNSDGRLAESRPRVAIISFSEIVSDGRVQRQIKHAAKEFDIDVFGFGRWEPEWPEVRFHSIPKVWPGRWARRKLLLQLIGGRVFRPLWKRAYWSFQYHGALRAALLESGPFALIHANDVDALPVACEVARGTRAKVLFDAHEYHPGQARYIGGRRKWTHPPYISYLLRYYLPQVDAFITTSPGFADLYRKHFKVTPDVILNAPEAASVVFRPVDERDIRIVHHGAAKPARHIETFIEMMRFLDDRYSLELILAGDSGGYVQRLRSLAAGVNGGKIRFRDAVSPAEIVPAVSEYDIGVHALPPSGLNHLFPLPNKLFEFICAGVVSVIGPSPEMAKIVRQHGVGVVASDHTAEALAAAIAGLTPAEFNEMKKKALIAGKRLNADVEMAKLIETYHRLLT